MTGDEQGVNVELMRRMKKGFATADGDLLGSVLADDFEWHMHWFGANDPTPTGNVVTGVAGVVAELAWRAENWTDVRFDGVAERYVDDMVVQTFRISGNDHRGEPFANDVVDLYRIDDGKIALKDTYWKRPAVAGEER